MTAVPQPTSTETLTNEQRAWVLACGTRYWPRGADIIATYCKSCRSLATTDLAPVFVRLPAWAADVGIDGQLLMARCALAAGECEPWQRCDWIAAAWTMLTGAGERRRETQRGPIHSYAIRLGEDRVWYDHAWVNRIFLFLRRAAAHQLNRPEYELFGPLPEPEIVLTHDLDALWKTPEIRIKQSAFMTFSAVRLGLRGNVGRAADTFKRAALFASRAANFNTLAEVAEREASAGLKSIIHVYGGPPGRARRTPARILIDPAYDVSAPEIATTLRRLADAGWTIGLHQSSAAWRDATIMRTERECVEEAIQRPVTFCRQHWLKFSWAETWAAQEAAGLRQDSTLGFNDRPGFRNSAALRLHPWNHSRQVAHTIEAIPMVLMDSHFYDYAPMTESERRAAILRWILETRAVRGQATVNWHTHTLSDAYGWRDGYIQLLDMLK